MYQCYCGRRFEQTNAFSNHQRSCKKAKTRLSSALDGAKEKWYQKKKARIEEMVSNAPLSSLNPSTSASRLETPTSPPTGPESTISDQTMAAQELQAEKHISVEVAVAPALIPLVDSEQALPVLPMSPAMPTSVDPEQALPVLPMLPPPPVMPTSNEVRLKLLHELMNLIGMPLSKPTSQLQYENLSENGLCPRDTQIFSLNHHRQSSFRKPELLVLLHVLLLQIQHLQIQHLQVQHRPIQHRQTQHLCESSRHSGTYLVYLESL